MKIKITKNKMIIVHDTFVCKPGNASKMAKLMKESMTNNKNLVNIMTDMTGKYNRVIMVSQFDNLTTYEKAMEEYMNPTPEMKKNNGENERISRDVSNRFARNL